LPDQPNTRPSDPALDDWDEHWSRYAEASGLNPAQGFRRRLVVDALAITRPGARILDIGSGTGDLAAELAEELAEPQILGLELSATGVEIAHRKVPGAEFVQCDLLAAPQPGERHSGWAEAAVCSEVLEHVDDPVALIANARPFMAPRCRLVVTVPGGPMSAFDQHIGHRRHYRPMEAAAVLAAAGYEIESARGAGFPFFNLYRYAVIAAGERLVEDSGRHPGRATRTAGSVFRTLLAHNRRGRRLGWQTVVVARNP
jgi:2-polyprenyl-3-methyl-5-hydroxy-6-metoxy-1,4-benzoquinol methylase